MKIRQEVLELLRTERLFVAKPKKGKKSQDLKETSYSLKSDYCWLCCCVHKIWFWPRVQNRCCGL
jgi:hypothetical protein